MKTFIKVALMLSIIGSPHARATIVSATNMAEAEKMIMRHVTDKNKVLVAFDVDLTLVVPAQPALYYPNVLKHKAAFKKIFEPFTAYQQKNAINLAVGKEKAKLVENEIPQIIQTLQKQGIPTMAFTAFILNCLDKNDMKAARIRSNTLKKFGINFSKILQQKKVIFKTIQSEHNNSPIYYKGILFANGDCKGQIIVPFLQHLHDNPQIFIMIDDQKHILEEIEIALHTYDPTIQFIGIEYLQGKKYAPTTISETDFIKFWQNIISTMPATASQTKL